MVAKILVVVIEVDLEDILLGGASRVPVRESDRDVPLPGLQLILAQSLGFSDGGVQHFTHLLLRVAPRLDLTTSVRLDQGGLIIEDLAFAEAIPHKVLVLVLLEDFFIFVLHGRIRQAFHIRQNLLKCI